MNVPLVRPTLVVGSFLTLHLLLGIWYPLCMWGGDMLAFYPVWIQSLFVFTSALLLIPATRRALVGWILEQTESSGDPPTPSRSYRICLLLALVGGILFIGLHAKAHLLGDGYLYIRELDKGLWQATPRTDRAPLSFWMIRMFHQIGGSLWGSAETTYRIYSHASGILYLIQIPFVGWILGRDRPERIIIVGLLLTPGYLQLFFGYVETYPFLFPTILFFLLTGSLVLKKKLSLWVPSAILGILIPLHFMTAALVPSLLILAVLQIGIERKSGPLGFSWKRTCFRSMASLVVVPGLAIVIFYFIDYKPLNYLNKSPAFHLLSPFAVLDFSNHYPLFSFAHLRDVLNQYLLVAPAALITLGLVRRHVLFSDPDRKFLLTAFLFPILFTLITNPEVGAFRDWDAFAYPAVPFTLWAAVTLNRRIHERSDLIHTGILVGGATAMHTLLWIGLNANPGYAARRYADILEHCHLSGHARSYGWETLGSYYHLRGKDEEELHAYRQALEANSNNPRHWVSVGIKLCSLGEYQTGIDNFRKAIDLDPNFHDAYVNLSAAYNRLGEHETAIEFSQKAIELNPNLENAYINMGGAFLNLNQPETAVRHFQKSISLKPDNPDAYYNLGTAFQRMNEYETAIQNFQKTISLKPDYADAYLNLGAAYLSLNQIETAIHAFRKTISIKPENADAHYNVGISYLKLQQYKKAIEYFQKTISLKSDYTNAYSNLGAAYLNLQQYEKAIEYFEKTISLRPNDAEAHYNVGISYLNLQQYKTAIEHLQKTISLQWDFANAYSNLGGAYLNLQQYEKAIEHSQRAISMNPEHPEPYYNVGIAYYNLGQHEKAIKYFEKTISLRPNDAEAYYNIATAYQSLGNSEKAMSYFQKSKELNPDDSLR